MKQLVVLGVASIPVIGIFAQWLAWRIKLPSILLLLLAGIVAGPLTGFLSPDALLGDALFPVVSLSVGIILFEGGLSLKLSDLKSHGRVVWNLITIGVIITWIVVGLGAHLILGLDLKIAALLGAVLTVTGPTVVLPLLKTMKLKREVASVLRWEGITIDPIGASLSVLVFEFIMSLENGAQGLPDIIAVGALTIVKTVGVGLILGLVGAGILVFLLRGRWSPESLHEALTLMVVMSVYTASNVFVTEAGLFAVTVMGIAIANQELALVRNIVIFKENLVIILLSVLFVLLGARLDMASLQAMVSIESVLFMGVVVLVARPLAVVASSFNSSLRFREKLFISWMAPRGIVAAAVSSLFALELQHAGIAGAERLVPATFLVIISTVVLYGFTAKPLAAVTRLSQPARGLLVVGAHDWARDLALLLQTNGIQVLMVDTNKVNVVAARSMGLTVLQNSILSHNVVDELEFGCVGRMLAMTPSHEVNLLAAIEYGRVFGKRKVYLLPPAVKDAAQKSQLGKANDRYLFGKQYTYTYLSARYTAGASVSMFQLTHAYTFEDFKKKYRKAVPLFLITPQKHLMIFAQQKKLNPQPGHILIAMV